MKQVKGSLAYRKMAGQWDGAVCQGPVERSLALMASAGTSLACFPIFIQ